MAAAILNNVKLLQETSVVHPHRTAGYHGETINFTIDFRNYGAALDLAGATATLYWRVPGDAEGYWHQGEATCAGSTASWTWDASMDNGESPVLWFLQVVDDDANGTASYRATGEIKLLASPGFVPAVVPPARITLDFDHIDVLHAPYWTKEEADERFAAAADIALEAAALGSWDLSPLPAAIQDGTPNIVSAGPGDYQWRIGAYGAYSEEHYTTEAAAQAATAITINGPDCPTPTEITRAATAYRLGPDATANPNRDKPLAPADAIPAVVAPSTSASDAGKAADAKATGEQLARKLDKSGGEIDGDVGITGGLQMTGQGGVMSNSGGFQTQSVKFIGMRFIVATDIPHNIDFPALKGGTLALTSDILDPTLHPYAAASGGIALAPGTAVYRAALGADGAFPAVSDTAIPVASAYYAFEIELAIPATVPASITPPTGWTWLEDGELPAPSDLSGGETVYIAVRLDCASGVRAYTANVWRVA